MPLFHVYGGHLGFWVTFSLCSLMSSKKIYTDLIIKKKVVTPIDPLKGTRIQPQFLFLMEKSILCAKITVSKKIVSKLSFKYYIGLLFS